jgi:hypothetical protein
MKKYIGKEEISAEPMTYGEAFKDGIIPENAYVEELSDSKGYKIVGVDKAVGWLPKDDFESLYRVAETHLDRINIEDKDLREKCCRLSDFINNNDKFKGLSLGDKAMLVAQFHMMNAYSSILSLRQSTIEGGVSGRPYGFSFEQVLPLIREGYAVRRNGWNGKGLMVFKQIPAHIGSDIIPKMQSLPNEAKRLILAHGDHIDYVSQCLIFNADTGEANSWAPSISDVFANDWELVVE